MARRTLRNFSRFRPDNRNISYRPMCHFCHKQKRHTV